MKNVIIDFSKLGGYRLKQATLDKMQESYMFYLKTLVSFLGCEETGSYIISGCEIVGANITAGMMYIDGELCPFESTTGDANTLIAKQATTSTLNFKNGVDQPVFRELEAVKVSSAGTKWSDFIKFNYVNDANYVHTDENFTAALRAKLNDIEDGAEVNVQADWNVINPISDAYIKNKPIVENIVQSEHVILGHFPNGGFGEVQRRTIDIDDVGTVNYKVRAWIKSNSNVGSGGKDVICIATSNYQTDSFDIIGGEFSFAGVPEVPQNVILFYEIILL